MAARLAAESEPLPGYRLLERLGRGGFGEVWKAQAPGGILKAIKFVYGNLDEATEDGKPAAQELKALNRVKSIRHPYILSLERFDVIDGQLLIVMELADRNLFDRFRECQEQGLLGIPREELIGYMEEAAEALDLMNNQFQLQHLDIKPQNIFLVFNHIKVADFGLAKDLEGVQATLTGGVTPVYAAPETFECRVTRFCDQYSLAIVFQELLTGERPFNGTTARQLMMQHIQAPPDLSSLPIYDRSVIAKALAKDPDQRFATCAELVKSLKQAARPAPQRSIPDGARLPVSAGAVARAPQHTPTTMPGGNAKGPAVPRHAPGAGLPALVANAKLPSLAQQRPSATPSNQPRQAPPEKTGDGVLMPALVVGLGRFGLMALHRLRRAVRDKFGSGSLPHLRLLYIDTEADTLQSTNSSSAALEADEVFLARLNRPSHYSQPRPDLPPVADWLNPQLLYRLPRKPTTLGIRAFGRLALCDHYRALRDRIRTEIDECTATAALEKSAAKTKLTLRTNRPRVYVVASLMGGTGGGMFLDVAYVVRHCLRGLGYNCPDVHGLLYVPHVDGDTPRNQAIANAHAALTELVHYSTPTTQYEALFDSKEGPIVDRDRPFQSCMMLQLPDAADPSLLRPVLGTGTNFLFQELLSPVGREADKVRGETTRASGGPSHLQTCGSFRLSWPLRTLLERAARRACARAIAEWATREASHLVEPVREWVEGQCSDLEFNEQTTLQHLRAACCTEMADDPLQITDAAIKRLEENEQPQNIELSEFCAALELITEAVGRPEVDPAAGGGRCGQAIEQAAQTRATQCRQKLCTAIRSLVERAQWRLAGAEEAQRQISSRLRELIERLEGQVTQLHQEAREAFAKAYGLLASLETITRGSRRLTIVKDALAQCRLYAHKRFEFLTRRAAVGYFRTVSTFESECQREVQTYRQKLESLQQLVGRTSSSAGLGHLGPERPLLPAGCRDLDEATNHIVSSLGAAETTELEQALLTQLGKQCLSFTAFLADKTDHSRGIAALLIEQARAFFEPRLKGAGNVSVLFEGDEENAKARQTALEAYTRARPTLGESEQRNLDELCVVAVPSDAPSVRFSNLVQEVLAQARPLHISGTTEIIFHREVQNLDPSHLPQLGDVGREAVAQIAQKDQRSPFTREDVKWQLIDRVI